MAASSSIATAISYYRTQGSVQGSAPMRNLAEAASQTFNQGVPVQLASGYIQECASIVSVATAIIAGFSLAPGAGLTSAGVPKVLVTGWKVPNQSSAVVQPIGAPLNDGTNQFTQARGDLTFIGTVGNSNTAANATLAQTMVGAIFGLTKDAGNNFWYVDNYITTAANGACVEVVGLVDAVGTLNGRVEFRVTAAAQQL